MLNLKKFSLSVAALLLCCSVSAQAAIRTDSAELTFAVGSLSNASVNYSWTDLWFDPAPAGVIRPNQEYDGEFGYRLVKLVLGPNPIVSIGSVVNSGSTGSGTFSFGNLAAGTYKLTFAGLWSGIPAFGTTTTRQDVSLSAATITPVPEPASYVMLLAGLGMMGFVARRRQNKA